MGDWGDKPTLILCQQKGVHRLPTLEVQNGNRKFIIRNLDGLFSIQLNTETDRSVDKGVRAEDARAS